MAIHKNISFQDYIKLPGFNASLLKPYSISPKYGYYMEHRPFKGSQAMNIGTLAHSLILEGQAATDKLISEQFITEGFPINEKTGKPYGENTKKWQDWLPTVPKYKRVILPEELERVKAQANAVAQHQASVDLLNDCPMRETAVTWKCEYTGQDMKALVDFFGKSKSGDLKTFGRSLSIGALEREMYDRQYHMQFSMYADGLHMNGYDTEFYAIFVQSKDDYDVGCFNINYTALEQGRSDYIQAIANYHKARQSKVRAGRFPQVQDLGIPYWSCDELQNADNLPVTFGE